VFLWCSFNLTFVDCGPQLRQDDPAALKDVVFLLQKAVAAGDTELPVRTKFMIETISNLKNNRLKTSNAAAITSEHVLRLKKTLGSLKTRSHTTTEPLNVSLKDIQRADKTGKWWLVGASWKDEKKEADGENDATHKEEADDFNDEDVASADLLALAKQHRMNTNVRRAIFVAIMSSTDYREAWLKLRRLSLSKSQRCEIPRVLVHCAGAEGAYNPYYRLVAGKLCSERAHQVSFRFNLWGVFRRMGDSSEEGGQDYDAEEAFELRELVNLAKFFGELIGTAALPITVLKVLSKSMLKGCSLTCRKVLDFVQLKDQTKIFLEVLLVTALQTANKRQNPSGVIADIFGKAREEEQMATGLRYLLSKAVGSTKLVTSSTAKRDLHKAVKTAKSALAGLEVPPSDF
jgi:nucleolar MIF4G domain-containing protein 1